ncbi:hypothetical protein Sjap_019761 [Stephania japonica]|uniref:Uncharacterized protein n=1 Tax=Stephania japonica TaxID=461633 RepID=A0AAP0HYF2_9MAGN
MMINNGNQSPIVPIPMPPPPPPPPFQVPAMKFVVRGGYLRIKSATSSRTGSPEPEVDSPNSTPTSTSSTPAIGSSPLMMGGTDGGDSGMPVFCPSPDVNTKADAFIERLRAGWRLEKVNSIKAKQQITG